MKVGGGVSVRRAEDALQKRLDAMKKCVERAALKAGKANSGVVKLRARVDSRGKLAAVEVAGELAGVDACLSSALEGATIPAPDTGETALSFALSYKAS